MRAVLRLAGVATAAAVVLLPAVAASASGHLDGVPGKPVTAPTKIALTASVDDVDRGALELRLIAPDPAAGAFDQQNPAQDAGKHAGDAVATAPAAGLTDTGRSLAFTLDTADCRLAVGCGGWSTAPNGRWTVQLNEDSPPPGSQLPRADFLLDVPAQPPAHAASALQAGRQVTVSWARGPEPDLLHWDVADGHGQLVRVTPAQACPEGAGGSAPTSTTTCGVTLSYAASDTGTRDYSVTATRKCGTAGCTAVASKPSTAGGVTLPAATSSAPSSPSAVAAGKGGSVPGAPTTDPRAFARSFSAPSTTGFGVSRLPSLPSAPAVAAPQAADGPFSPTLGYPDKTEDVPEPGPTGGPAGQALSRLTSTGGGLLGDDGAMQSIAGALVLALGGLHLRSWSSRGSLED